ncbi:MAG: ABC transporter permease [Lutisporaceae bacterium]|jgi:peptide/nickel transport system permease protein
MWKYIAKRLLMMIPVVIGVTFLVFFIMNIKPGDPGRMVLGLDASQEAVNAYNAKLGLNQPYLVRYMKFLGGLLHGDLGNSWYGGDPVIDNIKKMFPVTVKIAVLAIIFATVVGVPIGVLSAVKQYSLGDRIASIFAMMIASTPSFWLCLLLLLIFSVRLGWLPPYGLTTWKHYIMPVFVLGANTLGMCIRMTRTSMLEEIRQDYIRTARAKGMNEGRVIFVHALYNSLIPVITAVGTNFSLLLGATVYVESIFALSGLGNYLIKAVNAKDIPIVMGCITVLAIATVLINLIIDLLYAAIDPRIKAQYIGTKNTKTKKEGKEIG